MKQIVKLELLLSNMRFSHKVKPIHFRKITGIEDNLVIMEYQDLSDYFKTKFAILEKKDGKTYNRYFNDQDEQIADICAFYAAPCNDFALDTDKILLGEEIGLESIKKGIAGDGNIEDKSFTVKRLKDNSVIFDYYSYDTIAQVGKCFAFENVKYVASLKSDEAQKKICFKGYNYDLNALLNNSLKQYIESDDSVIVNFITDNLEFYKDGKKIKYQTDDVDEINKIPKYIHMNKIIGKQYTYNNK